MSPPIGFARMIGYTPEPVWPSLMACLPYSGPWFLLGKQLRKLGLKNAKFIFPGVLKHPKGEATFLLEIPTCGSKRFEALHFRFKVVGFYVEVHTLFRDFLVRRSLYQNSDIG